MALMYKIVLNRGKYTNARKVAVAYRKVSKLPYSYNPEIYYVLRNSNRPISTRPKRLRHLLIKKADRIIFCNIVYGINADDNRIVISYIPSLKWSIVSFTSYETQNIETDRYLDDIKAAFRANETKFPVTFL